MLFFGDGKMVQSIETSQKDQELEDSERRSALETIVIGVGGIGLSSLIGCNLFERRKINVTSDYIRLSKVTEFEGDYYICDVVDPTNILSENEFLERYQKDKNSVAALYLPEQVRVGLENVPKRYKRGEDLDVELKIMEETEIANVAKLKEAKTCKLTGVYIGEKLVLKGHNKTLPYTRKNEGIRVNVYEIKEIFPVQQINTNTS